MKKNAVGRVLAHKVPVSRRISALHLPAWFLCLLLALVIWLLVVNLNQNTDVGGEAPAVTEASGESV